ncbi:MULTISPECIES: DUF1772 domain-containing protein [unclassified Solwaraspora]|uniref:DUF1772 domain-containing protein n=1 Tax=unclassified Solwaraspora TaxID=2627926 RepID=UPI00259B998C|nr:DUF1772 domain-containing protein [Solwaraspora sp. WMMA2056]WJK38231.1 DUF1772 domain-containing protein [Solwaraspora sp. WMMA2056]
MSALAQTAAGLAAVCNGVAAGIMVSTVVGIVPMMVAQPYRGYVRTVQFLWPRYDPLMPILNGTALALAVVAAIAAPTASARTVLVVAAALLATVMAISIVKNVPVNRYVSRLDPGRQPDDWARLDPRLRWQRWNRIRTAAAVLAFIANVAATGLLT